MKRRVQCGRCGWIGLVAIEVRVVFHPCRPVRQRRRISLEDMYDNTSPRERLAEYRSQLYAALVDGEEATWRA